MTDADKSTYDDVVGEVADDLGIEESELRDAFGIFINTQNAARNAALSDSMRAACYAVYRLTKLRGAFHMTAQSRERWRERAMELGSPPHLVKERSRHGR